MELDPEEQEILQAFDAGELKSVPDMAEEIRRAQAAAERFFRERGEFHVRLPLPEAALFVREADAQGYTPEQLIAKILHQYATGNLRPAS